MRHIRGVLPVIALFAVASCDDPTTSPLQSSDGPSALILPPSKIVDLGTLGGGWSIALDVNNRGIIVGNSTTADGSTHAFRWTREGGMKDLGTLGGKESYAIGVNQAGYIAGWSRDAAGAPYLVMWNPDGKMRSLALITAEYGFNVMDFNDRNEIVGSWQGYEDWAGVFRWSEKTGIVVLAATYDGEAYAEGTNNNGDIVGYWCCGMNDVSLYGAFFSERGTGFRDMGGVTNYAAYAYAVNDSRVVVGLDLGELGEGEDPWRMSPFRWTPLGGYQLLGSLGGNDGMAININNRGEIVGVSELASGEGRAFFWSQSRGMVNLGPGVPHALNNELPWIVGERNGRATLWMGSGGVR